MLKLNSLLLLLVIPAWTFAQTDSTATEEEDFSMYENLDFADAGAKRFCTPKVFDLTPAKLIWLGFDHQGAFGVDYGAASDTAWTSGTGKFSGAGGLRFGANIPVISKTNVVWQLGFNYARAAFNGEGESNVNSLDATLRSNGLTTAGINTTLFKPLGEEKFIIAQGAADLNGDYYLDNFTPLKYTRYSAAVIYGKKKSDRKMIGFGLSRTYRAGDLNYIPVMLLNWTAPSRKWGVEMLAPARANIRKTISARNILLFGYELEGNSYRVLRGDASNPIGYELRRSELRFRAVWETSMYQFIWMSLQAGYRYGYSFNLDSFAPSDKEFFRGFFGDQPFAQENEYKGTWYAQLSVNLVSP
ncbi:MAG: hypothetical protein ACK478_08090 [Flavobacteriales bacterium]|jgi:hypothetical protein